MRVSSKATNLSLLTVTLLAFASGLGAFLVGASHERVVVTLHGVAGCTLLVLFFWKRRIIIRSIRRHGGGLWLLPSAALLSIVLGALATGLASASFGLPTVDGYSGITLHVALGAGAVLLLVPHGHLHWPRVRSRDLPDRRTLLRSALILGAGAALWQTLEVATAVGGLSGARRRFTGSRLDSRFSGNDYPSNSWLFDNPEPLAAATWTLTVSGHVREPLKLHLSDVGSRDAAAAVLDCTGGWYTEQNWQGVSLAALLARAGMKSGARSVVVRGSTGYWRRYTLAEARGGLLATTVGDEPITHEHGAPLRLVMPGMRGYEWVKWVTSVEVSRASPLWKWPLPIS